MPEATKPRIRQICCFCKLHDRKPAILDGLGPLIEGDLISEGICLICHEDELQRLSQKRKESGK
jgi:hypothetical protein